MASQSSAKSSIHVTTLLRCLQRFSCLRVCSFHNQMEKREAFDPRRNEPSCSRASKRGGEVCSTWEASQRGIPTAIEKSEWQTSSVERVAFSHVSTRSVNCAPGFHHEDSQVRNCEHSQVTRAVESEMQRPKFPLSHCIF